MNTIFIPHYFAGEYDLTKDLNLPGLWVSIELEPDTWRKAIGWAFEIGENDDGEINKTWLRFIRENYPDVEIYLDSQHAPQTILSITHDPNKLKPRQLALACELLATEYADNTCGDDDTFDYAPNTLAALQNLCVAIGEMDIAEKIGEIANELEQGDGYPEDGDENGDDGP